MSFLAIIVDDDHRVARALQRSLRSLGIDAIHECDPQVIEATLRRHLPQLIISDLHMPRGSGLTVLKTARSLFPLVLRCLTSGSLGDLRQADLAQIEPCALLSKPWSTHSLEEMIQQTLKVTPHAGPSP